MHARGTWSRLMQHATRSRHARDYVDERRAHRALSWRRALLPPTWGSYVGVINIRWRARDATSSAACRQLRPAPWACATQARRASGGIRDRQQAQLARDRRRVRRIMERKGVKPPASPPAPRVHGAGERALDEGLNLNAETRAAVRLIIMHEDRTRDWFDRGRSPEISVDEKPRRR